jgi:hypothetical protein
MSCEEGVWTFRFPTIPGENGPFEIKPISITASINRSDYDYAKAKFDTEIGDTLRPHTRNTDGRLNRPRLVEAIFDGEVVNSFYFKPDAVNYGNQYTRIEFFDPQESLESGVVDKEWDEVKLRDAYKFAFEARESDKEQIISDINFTDADILNKTLVGSRSFIRYGDSPLADNIDFFRGIQNTVNRNIKTAQIATVEADETEQLVDSHYAVSFDKVSPARAIQKLNKKFNLTAWVNTEAELWIGSPEVKGLFQNHIAAADDERVWRYNKEQVNIRHPRTPVKQVTVEGAWKSTLYSSNSSETAAEKIVNSLDEDRSETKLLTGVAYRTDIEYGESIVIDSTKGKRDAVTSLAEKKMRELMKAGNTGTVEITPALSGDFTKLHLVSPGDFIQLVPNDKFFYNPDKNSGRNGNPPDEISDCESYTQNALYFIKEVRHTVDNGLWTVELEVAMYPDQLQDYMESVVRYFDPVKEEYLTTEQFNNLGKENTKPASLRLIDELEEDIFGLDL